ncbi:sushi, von Willebrand factor type A, EGF and pentraxin domain-containing protein 1-like, partial [Saccostrea cucullata]|uniref:sushi, von Willebrand factor type A, EGF and pentraxin domain-containing protein 1-like n=1 Tax=Saccostrea cuccullata TaxID=36930 RepID=UPI002ED0F81A
MQFIPQHRRLAFVFLCLLQINVIYLIQEEDPLSEPCPFGKQQRPSEKFKQEDQSITSNNNCLNGQCGENISSKDLVPRVKRRVYTPGERAGAVVLSVLTLGIYCIFMCEKVFNDPPSIRCPAPIFVTAKKGHNYADVSWPWATASDRQQPSIGVTTSPSGIPNPIRAGEGETKWYFVATDKHGERASCPFKITVNVIKCPSFDKNLLSLANMEAKCERNPIIYGSKCHLRCITGYEIKPGVKQITLECLADKSFSGNIPTCKKVTCNKHDMKLKVNNGKVNCRDYTYESKCQAECKQGYTLSPGVNSVICQADKSWSSKLPDCADTTRPIIVYCPSDINLFADARANYTHVTWSMPRAADNSGGNLMIQQTEGPPNGSMFYVGTTQIKYKVTDSSGNSNNDCNFRVTVDEISCGWPILPDRYMNVDCPDGLTSGVECRIDCGTFEVVGNTTVFCEKKGQATVRGEWNYGQKMPYCKKNPCEPLPAPANGAMACDEWLYGVFCQMQCMEGYDIPNGAVGSNNKVFTGRYVCSETKGIYIPSNTVPNCTAKRLPSESNTLMEFFYYTGDCNNKTVQEEIRTNFITYIRDMNDNGGFDGICPDEISCNVANVSVSCGEISNRKRRAAVRRTTLKVQFELQTRFLSSNTTNIVNIVPKLQNKYMDVVKESAMNGTLDVGDMKVDSESFQIDEMVGVCDPGYIWKSSTISCVPCPPGTYLDTTESKCLDCLIGTYKETEESAVCTKCPAGTSTISKGSLSKTDCKDTCRPGTFSKTGLIPCVRCPYNHYQDQKGATSCSQCPKGKITTSVG